MPDPDDPSISGPIELPPGAVPKERPGKPGGRRDTNRRERVEKLVDSAMTLFLEQGIQVTTIDDITKAAGVAKGSFYRYFDSKEALVEFAMAPLRAETEEAFANCRAGLERARTVDAMMAVYEDLGAELAGGLLRHSEAVLLYLQESRAPGVGARRPIGELADLVTLRAVELTEVAHRHGVLRPFPERVSALAVVGAAERMILGLLREEDLGDPLKLPEQLAGLILDGLKAG